METLQSMRERFTHEGVIAEFVRAAEKRARPSLDKLDALTRRRRDARETLTEQKPDAPETLVRGR